MDDDAGAAPSLNNSYNLYYKGAGAVGYLLLILACLSVCWARMAMRQRHSIPVCICVYIERLF